MNDKCFNRLEVTGFPKSVSDFLNHSITKNFEEEGDWDIARAGTIVFEDKEFVSFINEYLTESEPTLAWVKECSVKFKDLSFKLSYWTEEDLLNSYRVKNGSQEELGREEAAYAIFHDDPIRLAYSLGLFDEIKEAIEKNDILYINPGNRESMIFKIEGILNSDKKIVHATSTASDFVKCYFERSDSDKAIVRFYDAIIHWEFQ